MTEEQRKLVAAWISEGAKLAEIQNRLIAEFGLRLTYMEARFLVDDLKLTPKDPEPPKVVAPPVPPAALAVYACPSACAARGRRELPPPVPMANSLFPV